MCIRDSFKDVSTTFVNLECALPDGTLAPRALTGIGQIVWAYPESLEYLRPIHAQAVGIANNHSHDFRDAGVAHTREAIFAHGLIPLGAGRTTRESPEVYVWWGPNELRIGFWAAAKAAHDIATDDIPGIEPATPKRALEAVQEMKRRGATF